MELKESGPTDALDKLKADGIMYAEFIMKNCDYYELMFNLKEPVKMTSALQIFIP